MLGQVPDIPGNLVVLATQGICQGVCAEVQGPFVAIFYRADDLQGLVLLESFVTLGIE